MEDADVNDREAGNEDEEAAGAEVPEKAVRSEAAAAAVASAPRLPPACFVGALPSPPPAFAASAAACASSLSSFGITFAGTPESLCHQAVAFPSDALRTPPY
eukprot:TRINITY_DN23097_c0_g1_i1.p3 TRINITY_DN23097_c0_g1~~TRINITY_DN23097_c0_g1_i1.p3  ORF type:complete len:102 (+),score=26.72 TRINITY_DN23097_c0_g1_i1:228-533(+)